MLASVYGLQAVIFILKRQWQHIGWMIIYLFAFPLFSFFIPVYAFWHFDDFSWGNTRVVVVEKGKKQIKHTKDDQRFDEKMIPKKKWADYEQERDKLGQRCNDLIIKKQTLRKELLNFSKNINYKNFQIK